MIAVIGMTDVLLARIASRRARNSISANSFCFRSSFSAMASTMKSASRTASVRSTHGCTRSAALSSSPRSRRLAAIRDCTVSRFWTTVSVMFTSWPASANTCAMPCPIKPAPTTAMRAFAISARRIAAVGVEDMAGVKIRRLGGEEEQWPGEIGRLAEAALWHAGDESFAHRGGALVVLIHPGGQRRAEHCRPDGIHRDAGVAPFAAERLGDAVDRRFRGAIGGVAGRMAQQTARRRHQNDLAAAVLRQHLLAGGTRHQP